jgi:hypothetical protein
LEYPDELNIEGHQFLQAWNKKRHLSGGFERNLEIRSKQKGLSPDEIIIYPFYFQGSLS